MGDEHQRGRKMNRRNQVSRRRRRPAASSAVARQGWTGPARRVGCWAGRRRRRGSSSRRAVASRSGSGSELGLLDEVVGRRPDRVVVGHDGVPRLGVAAFAGDDEHRRRPGALAVHVQRAAVADVDQAGEVAASRGGGRTTRDDGDDQDQPEQGLHARLTIEPTLDKGQVERVLVLGVTSKTFTRDELAAAFAEVRGDRGPCRADPRLGSLG